MSVFDRIPTFSILLCYRIPPIIPLSAPVEGERGRPTSDVPRPSLVSDIVAMARSKRPLSVMSFEFSCPPPGVPGGR